MSQQNVTKWLNLQAPAALSVLLFVAILLASLPLLLNPGYYAHDELQWLAAADIESWSEVPWQGWFDVAPFQYRPLTFNTWLLLSRWFGYEPFLMHSIVIAIGLLNAWLLRACLLGADVPQMPAAIATLLFVLSPHAVQVHGWVGTLGDLYVLLCTLLALRLLQMNLVKVWELLGVAALTLLALWSKESAIVFPALLLSLWPWRRSSLLPAVMVSAVVVSMYLVLRLDTILYAPRADHTYTWSFTHVPARLFDYAAFPMSLGVDEVHVIRLVRSSWRWVLGFVAGLILLATIARGGWRVLAMLVVGWMICLGPILLLSTSAVVYAYAASAWLFAVCAWTWGRLQGASRIVLLVLATISTVHGAQLAQRLHHVGVLQSGVYADLEALLPSVRPGQPLRIAASRSKDKFELQRLFHQVPSWRRLPLAGRVLIVDPDDAPSHAVDSSGRLHVWNGQPETSEK